MEASLKGKTIVNFGDSIFGNFRAPKDISTYIAELSGATVYNAGFGGCMMTDHYYHQFERFGMYRVADAVSSGDFFPLEEAFELIPRGEALPAYFRDTVATLKSINFSKVDIVTIAYGANDFTGEKPLEGKDHTDIKAYGGALRYSIEKLRKAHPHLKIVPCAPLYRIWLDTELNITDDTETYVAGGHTMADFCAKVQEIAEEYGLYFLDNYHHSGINRDTRHLCFAGKDGAHPTEYGRRLVAANMVRELTEHYGE